MNFFRPFRAYRPYKLFGVGGAGRALPSFRAFTYDPSTYELLSYHSGEGDVETDRVAPINVPDMDGVYVAVPGGQIAYPDARYDGTTPYADNGTGTLLDPIPSALVAPEAKNHQEHSRDLSKWTDSVTSCTMVYNQVGLNGQSNTATIVTDTSSSGYGSCSEYINIPSGSTRAVWRFFIDKASSAVDSLVGFQMQSIGGVGKLGYMGFNTYTGALVTPASTGVGDISNSTVEQVGGKWVVGVEIPLSGSTSMRNRLYPSRYDISGNLAPSYMGALVVAQVDLILDTPLDEAMLLPPIYTTTVAVLRDKDEVILDNLNLNAEEGSIYFEMIAGQDTTNLLDGFLSMTSGVVEADDGTNQASSAEVVVVGVASKIGMVWGSSGMEQCTDGVWSSLESYDGSLNDGVLDLFRNATAANEIRDLRIWDTAEKATIDGLMGA